MQKKSLALGLISLWFFYPLSLLAQEIPPAPTPPLVITEIAAFEPSETEWIEIHNKGETSIDLTGWKFFEDQTNHGLSVFRGDVMLDPGEFAVIGNKSDLLAQKYPQYTGTIFDSSWGSLKEDGEEIGVKDSNGNFLDRFIYPQTGSSTSLERIDLNVPATEPINWAPNPTSHSIGKARTVPEAEQPIETGTSTDPAPESITPTEPPSPSPTPVLSSEPPELSSAPPAGLPNPLVSSPEPTISSSTLPIPSAGPTPSSVPPAGVPNPPAPVLVSLPAPKTPPAKKNPAPSNTPPRTPPPPPQLYFPFHSLPQGVLELRGYFVFENVPSPLAEKPNEKQKLPIKEKTRTSKKQTSKTASYQNGDLSNDVRITEIFPAPAVAAQEWIEISNTGHETVNLGNWMLADTKKTSSPYLIPDSVSLKPGAYAVFQKDATHINLNNGKDTVFLADFEGNMVDQVTYESAEKAHSYAFVQQGDESTWQWTLEPTPGAKNPSFEKIEGRVSKIVTGRTPQDASEMDIQLASGESKKIRFTQETLDPLTAEVTMPPGVNVALAAQKENDGTYTLENIDGVSGAPRPAPPDAAKNSPLMWIAILALALSFITNGIPLFAALKKWRASRVSPQHGTTGFRKDETQKLEIAEVQQQWY